ncbi:acyl transferase [Allomuricauda sp. d1]|uniref:LuxE/PaaK family acyltransferase n=1 Tax=Allomuricauda sp. d1 TaxID=3136725 RepID=UPI0031D0B38C
MRGDELHRIFSIKNGKEFESLALETFQYQYENVAVYHEFCNYLGRHPSSVHSVDDIPFLPISFFRTHAVISKNIQPQTTFLSSGTTGSRPSQHFVADIEYYEKSFLSGFDFFYGKPSDYCILALLPSYLERNGSSLVYMANELIKQSGHVESGFYLYDFEKLHQKLSHLRDKKTKIFLIGVSFALLDFVEKYPISLSHCTVMETGGMKGRKKEMTREELHRRLKDGFGAGRIHSEYGMTELLSQAYSKGEGKFYTPPWMKVFIRDTEDPLQLLENEKTGGINVIDLANRYSCSFIATQDLGKKHADESFEVLGRFDHSDVRGCNLMVL